MPVSRKRKSLAEVLDSLTPRRLKKRCLNAYHQRRAAERKKRKLQKQLDSQEQSSRETKTRSREPKTTCLNETAKRRIRERLKPMKFLLGKASTVDHPGLVDGLLLALTPDERLRLREQGAGLAQERHIAMDDGF